jgi:hypothetical protein
VAGGVWRLQPLGHVDAGVRLLLRQGGADALQPQAHAVRELVGCSLGVEPPSQRRDVADYPVESRRRVVDHLHVEPAHLARRHCAHVAELLRDDDVGLDLLPDRLVDCVERLAFARGLGHGRVDLRTRKVVAVEL